AQDTGNAQGAQNAQNAPGQYVPQNGAYSSQPQPVPPAPAAPGAFYQNYAATPQPQGQYAPQNRAQGEYAGAATGYGMPQNAPYYPAAQADFEPETPMETPAEEPAPEKKRRPKFVDFFMKRNSDKK
ncbi:MAG: hypothetical protein ACI4SH_07880, partial [Candidatus Scatosoma sp.]